MAKTIEEIKEDQAVNHGWSNYDMLWRSFRDGVISHNSFNDFLDDVIKDCANSKLEEAAELSQEMMYERKPEVPTEGLQLRTFQVCYAVSKQSILNLREEV